jgi:hypothetical protein
MAWRLEGTYFENCNCAVICPCIAGFGLPADEDRCVFVLAFSIAAGEVDGVGVGGLGAVLVGDADRYMKEWRLGLLIDATATKQQRAKLEAVFRERFEALALGVEPAAIEIEEEGLRHRLRAGDRVELEVEDAPAADGSGPRRLAGLGHFASPTLTVAPRAPAVWRRSASTSRTSARTPTPRASPGGLARSPRG